ncbi:hypothetical protein FE782_17845 [Paenibacillus antri]|uniref:Glycosyl hydrolase family 43 n=1 Tax=Paenibacillus antri TaxID=2582848 RepID=A0A5R9GA05_9BACL|nr:hypothetical protein [Paenibacillus antri]TLS50910.1 hypothetical protein FE782_17845 [Paenibacillus antri]
MEKAYNLFGDDDGIYNYCPSPVRVDDTTSYVFYCANTVPGLVIDDIYARKGTLAGGRWTFGEKFRALEPSRLDWDCIHVCDPDVIKGEFRYRGETYSWMMVYLGCDIHYCYHNQVGVAFAKDIAGPYVKYDANPVVAYDETFHWGAGQASVVSLDGKGRFRMLYSQTVHEYEKHSLRGRVFWRDFDFGDADAPVVGEEVAMHEGGITDRGGAPTDGEPVFNNPTIVWDRETDTYYLTREGTPFDRVRTPGFIASYTQVCAISRADFERNEGGWRTVYEFGAEDTGFERNHNGGVFKDAYGWLYTPGVLPVAVTVSELKEQDFLWTYRLYYKELAVERGAVRDV